MHWYVMICHDVFQSKWITEGLTASKKEIQKYKTNMKTKRRWNWTKFASQSVQLNKMVRPAAWWFFESVPVVPKWPPAHLLNRWPVRKRRTQDEIWCQKDHKVFEFIEQINLASSCLDLSSFLEIFRSSLRLWPTSVFGRDLFLVGWTNAPVSPTWSVGRNACNASPQGITASPFGERFTFLSSSRVMRSKNRE